MAPATSLGEPRAIVDAMLEALVRRGSERHRATPHARALMRVRRIGHVPSVAELLFYGFRTFMPHGHVTSIAPSASGSEPHEGRASRHGTSLAPTVRARSRQGRHTSRPAPLARARRACTGTRTRRVPTTRAITLAGGARQRGGQVDPRRPSGSHFESSRQWPGRSLLLSGGRSSRARGRPSLRSPLPSAPRAAPRMDRTPQALRALSCPSSFASALPCDRPRISAWTPRPHRRPSPRRRPTRW